MSDSDPANIYSGSGSSNGDVYDAPVVNAVQRTLTIDEFYGRKLRPRPQQVPHQRDRSSGSSEKDDSDTDKHYVPQKDLSPKKLISPKKLCILKAEVQLNVQDPRKDLRPNVYCHQTVLQKRLGVDPGVDLVVRPLV